NGKYVSSENGKKAMNCNRTSVAKWEKFTVVDAGNGKIALKGSNGKYVNSGSPMYCNSSLTSATKFEWTTVRGGKIALKSYYGKYVSSENGLKSMNCNRKAIGGWEKFVYQVVKSTENVIENNYKVNVFPNPANTKFTVITEGFVNATLPLTDIRGSVILTKHNIDNQMVIPVDEYPKGYYLVRINDEHNSVVKSLIIQ
ncbi:MAG: T9SS type A sorting domain-containing protein, partial [Bacteroidales bacterium]|nr:T9SS type A sorting domain-containing protein [Bacteroidales bacterium]